MQASGYPVSCGKFEHGSQCVLDRINMFSHRMEFEYIARNVLTIYPKKGEVWALHKTRLMKDGSASPGSGVIKLCFRVLHVLQDVAPGERLEFEVLERMEGFRTLYKNSYEPGSLSFSYLVLFSHRVPAHKLQGNEGPLAADLKGRWDVDPAGLPIVTEVELLQQHEPVNTFNLGNSSSG